MFFSSNYFEFSLHPSFRINLELVHDIGHTKVYSWPGIFVTPLNFKKLNIVADKQVFYSCDS